jgi:hypothetical protein
MSMAVTVGEEGMVISSVRSSTAVLDRPESESQTIVVDCADFRDFVGRAKNGEFDNLT